MHVSQIKEPLPENRPLSKIRNPIPLCVEKEKKRSRCCHRRRIVNACGASDGTSRRCAPTHRGRLSCVTDDTGATKRHGTFQTGRTCVRVSLSTLRVGPAKLAISAKSDLLTGERREPARGGEKRTLKSLILSLHAVYSFQSKGKLEG